MRKSIIWMAFAATAAVIMMTGCNKEKTEEAALTNEPGTEIVFGAATDWLNDAKTRTEYSGRDNNDAVMSVTSEYERIDWVDYKDQIRVLCDAAQPKEGSGHMATYVVSNVHKDPSDLKKSQAGIVPVDNSLLWGTGTHYFYAMYPVPGMDSNYNFTDKTVQASNAKIESVPGNKAKVTGVIPNPQPAVKVGNIFKPNMNYAYMYATTQATPGQSGKVLLSFNPLVTTLQFYLTSAATDGATGTLTKVELSSTSTPLIGTFTASIDGTGSTPDVDISAPAYSTSNNKITITLPGGGVQLNDSEEVQVTFLTLPVEQTNLTLTLYFGDSVKRTIKLNSASGPVKVPACKKAYFHFGVPNTMYHIDAQPDVIMAGDELLKGGQRTVQVASYANLTGSPSTRAVSWKVYASTDNGAHYYSHGQSGWPEWLELSAYSGAGSVSAANLTAKVSRNPLTSGAAYDVATAGNGANMISALRNATVVTGPRDLSLYNIYGQLHGPSTVPAGITKAGAHTANTYVVSAPGTYCFPIVYGNGIDKTHGDGNGVYAAALGYNVSGDRKIWNASGANIASPYILSDDNLDKSGTYEAVIVWQDVHRGWEMLNDADVSIIDAPSGAGVPGCKYIQFYLDKKYILPGNFVIALRDKDLNRVLWSWQIWVTTTPHANAQDDFIIRTYKYRTKIKYENNSGARTGDNPPADSELKDTYMLNCNVGWTPPLRYTEASTTARKALLKFVQDEGTPEAKYDIVEVRQDAVTTPPYTGIYYSNTFYQWGRKDPMLPQCGNGPDSGAANKSHSDGETFQGKIVGAGSTTVYGMKMAQNPALFIRNPNAFDINEEGEHNNGMRFLWNYNYGDNVMTAADIAETVVGKTVYDPCPAGFTVPFGYAFTAFTRDGLHRDSRDNPRTPTHYQDFYGSLIGVDAAKAHPGGFMMTETGLQNSSDYTLYFAYTGHRVGANCGKATEQTYIWTVCTSDKEGLSIRGICFGSNSNIFPLFDAYHRMHAFSIRPIVEQ